MQLQWLRVAFGILVFSNAYAQDEAEIEKLMRKRLLSCTDITLNSSMLIPQYFNEGKVDSAKIILKYWEDKCGALEPIVRTKILFAVRENRFNEDIYDGSIIDHLLYYKNRVTALRKVDAIHWRNFNLWYGYPLDDAFDAFTTYVATDLLDEKDRRSAAYLFVDFYSGNMDSLFIKLKSPGYDHTAIKSYYNEYVASTLAIPEGNLGLIAGYWMPQGKNKLLGNHPSFGFFLGGKKRKFRADVVILFRFLKAKETYVAKYEGGFESTKNFFGGYIGVEGGRELLRTGHHEFDFSAGMGFDGFDALDKNQQHDAVTISSFNLNWGLGYRNFSHEFQATYIGLQVRYNFVRYATHGGSDLSGNTISLRLLLGLGGNQKKNQRLKSLEYHY